MLHTADVHLGSDGYGNAERQAAHDARYRRALSGIVDRALADRVDLVLIAGDLFDHNRVPDEIVAFVQAELNRLRQPVVILPGNHDSLYTNAIHDRHDIAAGASHVHVIRKLDGQVIEFPALDLIVWGRAMEEHEPAFSPLAHIRTATTAAGTWRWGTTLLRGAAATGRSSLIFADEIRDSGWDYIALGDQHVQTNVSQGSGTAYYSGAPSTERSGAGPTARPSRRPLRGTRGHAPAERLTPGTARARATLFQGSAKATT